MDKEKRENESVKAERVIQAMLMINIATSAARIIILLWRM